MSVNERKVLAVAKITEVMAKRDPLFEGRAVRVRRNLYRLPLTTLGDLVEHLAIPLSNLQRRTACADSSVSG